MDGITIMTQNGLDALANAVVTGTKVKPDRFIFSSQDIALEDRLTASDITPWITSPISMYQFVSDGELMFSCQVGMVEATDPTLMCGILLDDGTLFMISKLPDFFPAGYAQTIDVYMKYTNIPGCVDFTHILDYDGQQDLSNLYQCVVHGNRMLMTILQSTGVVIPAIK